MTNALVNIRSLAFGGDGVGEVSAVEDDFDRSLLGIAAFVPYSIPGEQIRAQIVERKKRYLRGDILEILEPSPARTTPPCRYFANCGGCELQHIEYPEQLRLKAEMIRGALKAGRLPSSVVEAVRELVPSDPYRYRRRVTLHLSESGLIGFYREHSRSVVSIESCEVAEEQISELLPKLSTFSHKVKGKVSSVLLECDDAGVVAVLKSAYALTKRDIETILSAARGIFENALLLSGADPVGGFGREILELPLTSALSLQVPAGNFSQINRGINRSLVEYVVGASKVGNGSSVFDLYAGAGNFAFPLARAGAKVVAVEVDTRLVHLGKQNAQRLRYDRSVSFVQGSVERFLDKEHPTPKLIIADPPRSGLGSLTSRLPKAERVILVSCHLPSCVRDLQALVESGYEVEEIQPFDMFAQTTYVEIASVLRRAG